MLVKKTESKKAYKTKKYSLAFFALDRLGFFLYNIIINKWRVVCCHTG